MKYLLIFVLIGSAYCNPGVFDWISTGRNVTKNLIDSTSSGIWEVLGKGNAVVQLGTEYASKGVDKTANISSNVIQTTANMGSSAVSGGANVAKSVLGSINNMADYFDSIVNLPLASTFVKPFVNTADRLVEGAQAIGQTGIDIGETVANAGVGIGQTVAQLNIKGLGTVAAAGTLGGQVGTAAAAAIKKTIVDNVANLTSRGLATIINKPNDTETNPLYTGTSFILNANSYDEIDRVTPYLIDAATKFWSSFSS